MVPSSTPLFPSCHASQLKRMTTSPMRSPKAPVTHETLQEMQSGPGHSLGGKGPHLPRLDGLVVARFVREGGGRVHWATWASDH